MSEVSALAELAMTNDLRYLDILSHNMANASTNGYKRDIPVISTFNDSLTSAGLSNNLIPGTALDPSVTRSIDTSRGTSILTGNPLDITLGNTAYLEVRDGDRVFYTKNGSLSLDESGRLVNGAGYTVSGDNGDIRLTTNTPRIDKQGQIYNDDELVATLKVVSFDDPSQLTKVSGELFSSETVPERLESEVDINIRQAHLEGSNVNPLTEITQLVSTVRHFQAAQKVLTGYDEAVGEAIRTIAEF